MMHKAMPPRFATVLSSLRDQAPTGLDQRLQSTGGEVRYG